MRKTFAFKFIACVLLMVVMILNSTYVFAHAESQEGILAKTYIPEYGGYYIGGEDVGWSIDEGYHTYGRIITYSFSSTDSYLTSTYQSYVKNGASKWSGVVKITNETDGSGTGLISTFNDPYTGVVAMFCNYEADGSGHLTTWQLQMNRAYTLSAAVLAHEFGHVIGLNDLYQSKNSNKLMYGYTNGTATGPTTSDILGAEVIIGVHSSHTWDYKYWTTNSLGNVHIKYCTGCQGLTSTTGACRYGSGSTCIVCGSGMYVPID